MPPAKKTRTKKEATKKEAKPLKYKAMVAKAAKKKAYARPSLKPPAPSPSNQLDTLPRLNVAVSASGYGTAFPTKGPPTGEKAYFRPAEQKITDPHDQTVNTELNVYGMVKLRNHTTWSSNNAMQMSWKTSRGETKSCDWRVSSANENKYINHVCCVGHLLTTYLIEQGVLFFIDNSVPNAANEWITKACKALNGLKDEANPDWVMKLYPGKDITMHDDVALDELLLDEEVVEVIKKNHSDLLVNGKLFEDEATLRLFFSEERDANLITALF